MPLYYAFWFLVGGVNLVTVRIGLAVNYLLCSLCAYAALRVFVSGAVAFLASLAFLSFDLTWTFNHIGAIPFLLLAIFCLWKFFLTRRILWCYEGLISLIFMSLVKITTGDTSFAAFWFSLLLIQGVTKIEKSQKGVVGWHLLLLPVLFGVVVLASYALLYRGLSLEWVSQCLAARPENRSWYNSPWTNFKHLIQWFLVWQKSRLITVGALFILGILGGLGWKRRGLATQKREALGLAVGSLFLFALANSFDYFAMEGLIYRFDFWIFPMGVLFAGLMAEGASRFFSGGIRVLLGSVLLIFLLGGPALRLHEALWWRTPERFLDFPHGRVYLGGPFSDVQVLKQGTRFILDHTTGDQKILAIPYDPIFCFLAGRQHLVRELQFLESMPVSDTRQETIIRELQASKASYVVVSNRAHAKALGVGEFGKTHCQKLAQFLGASYQVVKAFGPWESGPAGLYAIKLFERKT